MSQLGASFQGLLSAARLLPLVAGKHLAGGVPRGLLEDRAWSRGCGAGRGHEGARAGRGLGARSSCPGPGGAVVSAVPASRPPPGHLQPAGPGAGLRLPSKRLEAQTLANFSLPRLLSACYGSLGVGRASVSSCVSGGFYKHLPRRVVVRTPSCMYSARLGARHTVGAQ